MSGPSYPHTPNAYGFDYVDTVISQYANSPIIMALIKNLSECFDPQADFDLFYDNVWNINTANGAGLDLLGRILGVTRVVALSAAPYFGFAEAGNVGFGNGPFYNGQITTTNYSLSDEAYRFLLLAKAASNITDGSIKSINQVMMTLFPGRGNCYVKEVKETAQYFAFGEAGASTGFGSFPFYSGQRTKTMQIQYVFDFTLSEYELAIVQQTGVIPKPTGVSATIYLNPTAMLVPYGSSSMLTSDGFTIFVKG